VDEYLSHDAEREKGKPRQWSLGINVYFVNFMDMDMDMGMVFQRANFYWHLCFFYIGMELIDEVFVV